MLFYKERSSVRMFIVRESLSLCYTGSVWPSSTSQLEIENYNENLCFIPKLDNSH